jgi:hypothetical protein
VNLAEIAGNVAISYTLPGDARFIVAGITIDYVKKARGTIRAVGTCPEYVTSERREHLLPVVMTNGAGEVVALGPGVTRVKVGDRVIYGSYRGGEKVCVVTKVTKLHFCIADGDSKYRKSCGTMVGGSSWEWRRWTPTISQGQIRRAMDEDAATTARSFVQDYIESIRNTPAAFVPIAKFIKENMKCSDANS